VHALVRSLGGYVTSWAPSEPKDFECPGRTRWSYVSADGVATLEIPNEQDFWVVVAALATLVTPSVMLSRRSK